MVSLPHELIKGLISQNLYLIISGDALQMYTSLALPVTWIFHNLMKLMIKLAIAQDTPGNFQYLRLKYNIDQCSKLKYFSIKFPGEKIMTRKIYHSIFHCHDEIVNLLAY